MKCPYCGWDNRDDASSCEMCEMPLNAVIKKRPPARDTTAQSSGIEQTAWSANAEELSYAFCPHCGNPLDNCSPVSKTTITSSGGGYGLFSGCCGTVILGPLGLLCGLRRQSISSSSQTWWVCKKCGKEFVEQEQAKEIVEKTITSAATTTFIISAMWQVVFAFTGYSDWLRDIALLAIAGTWIVLPEGIRQSTGYMIKQLLTSDERIEFYKKCVFYGIIGFFLGAVIGGKAMEFLFA